MKIRELWKDDLKLAHLMLYERGQHITLNQLERAYDKACVAKAIERNGLEGFIIIKKLADLNELTHWHLNEESALILKALARRLGTVVTHEPEGSDRIKVLESIGFKQISKANGLLKDSKAVILKR